MLKPQVEFYGKCASWTKGGLSTDILYTVVIKKVLADIGPTHVSFY